MFLNLSYSSYVLLSQRIMAIDFFASVEGFVRAPQDSWCFLNSFLFPFSCSVYCRESCTTYCSSTSPYWPIRWPACPRHTLDYANHTCVSTCVFVRVTFRPRCLRGLFVLLHLNTCFSVLITALGFSSQTHPTALHILSAITSDKEGNSICISVFLAILQSIVE